MGVGVFDERVGVGVGVFDERVGVGLGDDCVGEGLVAVGLGVAGSAGVEFLVTNHQIPRPSATTRTPTTTSRIVRVAPPLPGGCGGCA